MSRVCDALWLAVDEDVVSAVDVATTRHAGGLYPTYSHAVRVDLEDDVLDGIREALDALDGG